MRCAPDWRISSFGVPRCTRPRTASLGLELFAYTLTDDIGEYYKIEADLFLEIDDAPVLGGVELA
jgi:hypothetical protein